MSGRTQFVSPKKALSLVRNKPCRICGEPSSCAVRDYGIAPACITHGLMAQRMGYIVTFPEPMITYKARTK